MFKYPVEDILMASGFDSKKVFLEYTRIAAREVHFDVKRIENTIQRFFLQLHGSEHLLMGDLKEVANLAFTRGLHEIYDKLQFTYITIEKFLAKKDCNC